MLPQLSLLLAQLTERAGAIVAEMDGLERRKQMLQAEYHRIEGKVELIRELDPGAEQLAPSLPVPLPTNAPFIPVDEGASVLPQPQEVSSVHQGFTVQRQDS